MIIELSFSAQRFYPADGLSSISLSAARPLFIAAGEKSKLIVRPKNRNGAKNLVDSVGAQAYSEIP